MKSDSFSGKQFMSNGHTHDERSPVGTFFVKLLMVQVFRPKARSYPKNSFSCSSNLGAILTGRITKAVHKLFSQAINQFFKVSPRITTARAHNSQLQLTINNFFKEHSIPLISLRRHQWRYIVQKFVQEAQVHILGLENKKNNQQTAKQQASAHL